MSTQTIVPLRAHELHLCVPFGHEFHSELNLPGEFIPDCFVNTWLGFLSSFPSVILGMWKEGALVGGIGGIVAPDLYDGRLYAQELFWFVGKAYRHGSGAIRLIKEFEQWALSKRAVEVRMSAFAGPESDHIRAVYEKLGYAKLEVGYYKVLPKE